MEARTDRIVNDIFQGEDIQLQVHLYKIAPDANQTTPFNKVKNEARKCQKAIADMLRGLEALSH